jgi:DNA modification methylase
LGAIIRGVFILIRVGDLMIVVGFFFLGLLFFIKDLLAMRRRAMRASRCTSASTWARKRGMSNSNSNLIRSIPLDERVIKLGQLMVRIRRKS